MQTFILITIVVIATIHLMMASVLSLYSRYKVQYLSLAWIMGIFGALCCVAIPFSYLLRFENIGLLHPFMPFITEELWQALEPRKEGESLMVAQMPEVAVADSAYLDAFEIVKEIVGGVSTIRLQKNIPNKDALELQIVGEHNEAFNAVIAKMCNLSSISKVEEKAAGAVSFLVRTTEYAVPLGNLINVEEELAKLQEELKYQKGFLTSVMKKLGNENFVSKAPAIVFEMEKKKQADAESKIKSIEESIAALTK